MLLCAKFLSLGSLIRTENTRNGNFGRISKQTLSILLGKMLKTRLLDKDH